MNTAKRHRDLGPMQPEWSPGQGSANAPAPVFMTRPPRYVLLAGSRRGEPTTGAQGVTLASLGSTTRPAANEDPSDLIVIPATFRVTQSTQVLHRWEGVVTEVGAECFVARVHETADAGRPEERAEFENDVVSPDDRKLLVVGAVFYWWLGYRRDADSTVTVFAEVRFRRLPEWTARDLAKLAAPSDLDAFFGE